MASSIPAKTLAESSEENAFLLDVRNPDEFALCRIEGASCIPLDKLTGRFSEIPRDRPVLVYCQSGNRSRQAIELLRARGFDNLVQVEGGIQEFERAGGKPIRTGRGIPIMRQVQLAAGSLVLLGLALALLASPLFLALPALVGAGLTFAGATGNCGMAHLLARMPWNRPAPIRVESRKA